MYFINSTPEATEMGSDVASHAPVASTSASERRPPMPIVFLPITEIIMSDCKYKHRLRGSMGASTFQSSIYLSNLSSNAEVAERAYV